MVLAVDVIENTRLCTSDCREWLELLASNSHLGSPFFSPHFYLAVAAVMSRVHVVKVYDGSRVAFFPFQYDDFGDGLPVGGTGNDCHGFVCDPHFTADPALILKNVGLPSWRFDHVPASQGFFARYTTSMRESPTMDLQRGFAGYCANLVGRGSQLIPRLRRKVRLLRKEVGEVRFEAVAEDSGVLDRLLLWKRAQLRQSYLADLTQEEIDLLRLLQGTRQEGFRGVLSALYAGDTLVAAHLGIASASIWHYWYPAHNPLFSRYSPGLLLLLRMAKGAESLGLKTIDLGKTTYPYKRRFMTSSLLLAEGVVDQSQQRK